MDCSQLPLAMFYHVPFDCQAASYFSPTVWKGPGLIRMMANPIQQKPVVLSHAAIESRISWQ